MSSRPARLDETVSVYVNDLRRRYPGFRHEHTEELKEMSHDTLSRFLSEHLVEMPLVHAQDPQMRKAG